MKSSIVFNTNNSIRITLSLNNDLLNQSQVLQHFQNDQMSMVIRRLDPETIYLAWENVPENYKINIFDLENVLKVIKNVLPDSPQSILIKSYPGVGFTKEAQNLIQRKDLLEMVSTIAVILNNSTERLSLNFFSTLHRSNTPLKGFIAQDSALQWLRKKQKSLISD